MPCHRLRTEGSLNEKRNAVFTVFKSECLFAIAGIKIPMHKNSIVKNIIQENQGYVGSNTSHPFPVQLLQTC